LGRCGILKILFLWNFFACKDAGFSEDVLVGLLLGKIQEFLRMFSGAFAWKDVGFSEDF
jgi:hypothetical protein